MKTRLSENLEGSNVKVTKGPFRGKRGYIKNDWGDGLFSVRIEPDDPAGPLITISRGHFTLDDYSQGERFEALQAPRRKSLTEVYWGSINEVDCQDPNVELDKVRRDDSVKGKKFSVCVKDGDSVKKVSFGDPDMPIRRSDDDARQAFRSRHNCDSPGPKTKARYWACRTWEPDFDLP